MPSSEEVQRLVDAHTLPSWLPAGPVVSPRLHLFEINDQPWYVLLPSHSHMYPCTYRIAISELPRYFLVTSQHAKDVYRSLWLAVLQAMLSSNHQYHDVDLNHHSNISRLLISEQSQPAN